MPSSYDGNEPSPTERPPLKAVVGIGVSAGGLAAATAFFAAMPADSGLSFLVVPHLDPERHSLFAELIEAKAAMPVSEAEDGERLTADRVYVIPPDRTLTVTGDRLRARPPDEPRGHRYPVDALFRSLAAEHGLRAVGIVLSGTGSDGTGGLRAIQAGGGLAVVQTPESAEFDGMPRSAIDARVVDHVLEPAEMPALLQRYADHFYLRQGADDGASLELESEETGLKPFLDLLRTHAKHDFHGYRRPTLLRRLHRRMGLAQVDGLGDYLELLRQRPDEVGALARDLLIHVTSFFRDPAVWDALAEEVIEPLVAGRQAGAPIRAWVPGCATGEEAYSLAMLLHERLAAAGDPAPLRVFATDVVEDVLARAREGLYADTLLAGLSPERRARFFTSESNGWRISQGLRDSVVFARHDLLTDPPFSHLDLISCRNVLIYLEPETQRRLLAILHLALAQGGHLLLGTAESVSTCDELFESVSQEHRIFRRVGPTRHDLVRFSGALRATGGAAPVPALPHRGWAEVAGEALVTRYAPASVLADHRHQVLYYHGDTDRFLAQPAGEPTRDLLRLARRGLGAPLRRALRRAAAEAEATERPARLWGRTDAGAVTITASRVESPTASQGLFLVGFEESPAAKGASEAGSDAGGEDIGSDQQLEEDLTFVREELRRTVEDAGSAQEELKAANEELTSMNEELQATNEELETSKEELQSFNEEMGTVNAQLERKMEALEKVTSDLQNLLASTDQATLFLDRELRIRRFTAVTAELIEIIPADVGRPLRQLAATTATAGLVDAAEAVLDALVPQECEVSAGDRWFLRRVLPYRGWNDKIEGVVVTFAEITMTKQAEEKATAASVYAEAIIATVREPLVVLTPDLRVRSANAAFYRFIGLDPDAAAGRSLFELEGGVWDTPELRNFLGEVLPQETALEDYEIEQDLGRRGRRVLILNAHRLEEHDLVLLAMEAITAERDALDRARHAVAVRERFLAALSHELRTPLTPALAVVSGLLEGTGNGAGPPGLAVGLETVQRNLEHEARLIDDLLDFSRIASGHLSVQPETADLRQLVANAAEVLTADRLEAADLSLKLSLSGDQDIWVDPDRITQVFRNLLTNAAKFTPPGGTITVRLRRADEEAVEIEIVDTGIGMSADQLANAFGRFGTPGEPAQAGVAAGLGLGLTISRSIVEQHGGTLTVASAGHGKGSTFTVCLPSAPDGRGETAADDGNRKEPSPGVVPSAPVRALPAEGSLRLLIVEDHADTRAAFAELMAADGHDVVTAGSKAEALTLAEEHCRAGGLGLDLVLCDLGLPDGLGVDLMRDLIERHRLAGIAVTGYGMDSDIEACTSAGFLAHVTKPVKVAELRRTIQALRPGGIP